MNPLRHLVCGVGSVGERYLRNLLALGQDRIALLRRQPRPLRTLSREFPVYLDLGRALREFRPEVALITSPTSQHVALARAAAGAGCHVLIEKPLSDSLEGIGELEQTLKAHQRIGMVGYMLRRHPLLRQIKSWLEEGESGPLGRPLHAHVSWGEHVPDWHPWEDYRETYAVRRDLGGGPALTLSHDIDAVLWMLGRPARVRTLVNRAAPLGGNTEHGVDWLLSFAAGVTAHVHADYFTRPPVRRWELVGTKARVVFDYFAGTLTRLDGRVGERPPVTGPVQGARDVWCVPAGWDRNDMFVDELRYFLQCAEFGTPPSPSLQEGRWVVELALQAVQERED